MGFFSALFRRQRSRSPEQLVDAVIADISHRLTEARLQVLAADLARKRLPQSETQLDLDMEETREDVRKLETQMQELQTKRDLLILRTRDADARLAVERSLMEVGSEPADVALQMLADKADDAQAEAEATAEVRQVSEEVRGEL